MFAKISNRDDNFDIEMWQLSQGCLDASFSPEVMHYFCECATECATSETVINKTYDEITNILSLGTYNFLFGTSSPTLKLEQMKLKHSISSV